MEPVWQPDPTGRYHYRLVSDGYYSNYVANAGTAVGWDALEQIPTEPVEITDLVRRDSLGKGSQGEVFETRVNNRPDLPRDLVYKRFFKRNEVNVEALQNLVRFRATLDTATRARLDSFAAWPQALVVNGSVTLGYLMPRIPEHFFADLMISSGTEPVLRELQHILIPADIAERHGHPALTELERLKLCLHFASMVAFFHHYEFVIGDISFKNEVISVEPRAVMLLDCDTILRRGSNPAMSQLHSPGWKPPEGGEQTLATDRFKLALAILRILTPEANSMHRDATKAVGILDRAGIRLLQSGLSDDPDNRTTALQWEQHMLALLEKRKPAFTASGRAKIKSTF